MRSANRLTIFLHNLIQPGITLREYRVASRSRMIQIKRTVLGRLSAQLNPKSKTQHPQSNEQS